MLLLEQRPKTRVDLYVCVCERVEKMHHIPCTALVPPDTHAHTHRHRHKQTHRLTHTHTRTCVCLLRWQVARAGAGTRTHASQAVTTAATTTCMAPPPCDLLAVATDSTVRLQSSIRGREGERERDRDRQRERERRSVRACVFVCTSVVVRLRMACELTSTCLVQVLLMTAAAFISTVQAATSTPSM